MAKEKRVTLWDREFQLVKDGLDQAEVIAFVDSLLAKLKVAEDGGTTYARSLDKLAEETVVQAERLADQLKEEAGQLRAQAQADASRITSEAQASAQEQGDAMARVASRASDEAQAVVQAARQKGAALEADARRRAEALVERAKQRIEAQIKRDVKGASEKLLRYVDDIAREVRQLNVGLDSWDVEPAEPAVQAAETPASEPTPSSPDPAAEPAPSAPAPAAPAPPSPTATDTHQGSLQLVIQAPVNLAGLGEIYERLVQLQDVTLRDTRKADDGSYVINLSLGHPTPLVDILRSLDNVAEANVPVDAGRQGDGDGPAPPASSTSIVVTLTG